MSALTGVVKKVGKVLDDMATDLYELSVVTTTGSVKTIEIDDKNAGAIGCPLAGSFEGVLRVHRESAIAHAHMFCTLTKLTTQRCVLMLSSPARAARVGGIDE